MDTEDNMNEEAAEDSAGLLDRYDELFEADGEAKEGTETILSDEDDVKSEQPEAEEVEEEEEMSASEDAEESEETKEQPEAEQDDTEKDDFDKDTEAKIDEMDTDAHPGIKFRELRNELKEAQQALELARNEATETEEVQALKLKAEESDTLKSELEELKKQLSVVEYRSTSEYKNQVETPMSELRSLSQVIEEGNSIDKGEVYRAVTMSDQTSQNRAIEAIVDRYELSKRDEVRLYSMADDVIKVNATEDHLKEVAQTRMGELNEMKVSETAEADAKQQRAVDNAINSTLGRFEGQLPGFMTEDGKANDVWNEVAKTTKDSSIASVEDEAHAIFAANAMPHLLDHIGDLTSQLKDKNVLLSRYTKAKPTKDLAPKTTEDKKVDDSSSFMDRLNNLKF